MRLCRTPLVLASAAVLLAACTPAAGDPVAWQALPLPDSRATVRDVIECGGGWLAVGALRLAKDPSVAPNEQPPPSFAPAAWWWRDGDWRTVPISPSTYYGERAILRSVACRDGTYVVVGAASGGGHGTPRVTTWQGRIAAGETTTMTQNPLGAAELFGGNSTAGVGRIVPAPQGWAIVGNWLDEQERLGPVVWLSADGHTWRRAAQTGALASTSQLTRRATDLMAGPDGLLLIGEEREGPALRPYAARSADGLTWTAVPVPGEGSLLRGGPLLLGQRGQEIVPWRAENGGWVAGNGFTPATGPVPPQVGGVVQLGGDTLVAGCGGEDCGLWASPDSGETWHDQPLPEPLAAAATTTIRLVSGTDGTALLLLDDSVHARVFVARHEP